MSAEAVSSLNHAAVVAALQKASAATGSNFDYLLKTAVRESGLRPEAQSATSSAAGLFQFVEQTWLGLVKEYGGRHGLSSYADAIDRTSDGRYRATSAAAREAVLALRNDPEVSAMMAGEYAGRCKTYMESQLGREVGGGELYAAHFLGADAACRLVRLNETSPDASAAAAFPQAAGANRSVFYRADGSAKSVREVYAWATDTTNLPESTGSPQVVVASSQPYEYVAALTEFETHLLASALLSESPTGGRFSGGLFSPFSSTYGFLDLLAGSAGSASKPSDAA
jgi:hypothetical protein